MQPTCFANNIDLIAVTRKELQDFTKRVTNSLKSYEKETITDKCSHG